MRKKIKSCLVTKIVQTEWYANRQLFEVPGKLYTFLNPVSYLKALQQKELFAAFDGILVDGGLLARAVKGLYREEVSRRSFDMTSLAPELFAYAEKHQKRLYLVGAKQEELEAAVAGFVKRYPRLQWAGYRNGYFQSPEERRLVVQQLVEAQPDFLIVGMGVIVQEQFLLEARQAGFRGIGFTCGGFFHQAASSEVDYYPAWINRMNLRFLYRMYREPHTRKRYLQAGLCFPVQFVWEKWKGEK